MIRYWKNYRADRGIDVEELLVPLKHVLDILQSDEKGGNHYE